MQPQLLPRYSAASLQPYLYHSLSHLLRIYLWGQTRVVFLWIKQRWHASLLLFCFQSKVSSWWMCFRAVCSPRAFNGSHSQLHSICLGRDTISEREGCFFGTDVCVGVGDLVSSYHSDYCPLFYLVPKLETWLYSPCRDNKNRLIILSLCCIQDELPRRQNNFVRKTDQWKNVF